MHRTPYDVEYPPLTPAKITHMQVGDSERKFEQARNTYTIRGLRVPELEADIATIRTELAALRALFDEAVAAITRLDQDIEAVYQTLQPPTTTTERPGDATG